MPGGPSSTTATASSPSPPSHIEPTGGPVEPLAHVYPLGMLPPGYYVFVFASDLGHLGFARFIVPGLEGDPVDSWQRAGRRPGLGRWR